MTDDDPDSSTADSTESVLEGVTLTPPMSLTLCPSCGEPVGSVTSRGPLDHTAGPCGCSLTPGEVRRL
ncbi:hypothetical protein [Natrinema halophilum]|uniref:Small CPxCG-related zinc finger protein n=1 Tax=Natrinema halophilum TaxID=1699371 RepID=A0A7D5H4E6_9EURY|nr:hypothetical protein [Natrinema halophilum]QLG47335.1 hypothetical protein HYG82_20330 [Natrinema halophilum]